MVPIQTQQIQIAAENGISNWVGWVCRRAIATVSLSAFLTVALLYYAATNIGISTDTTDMLSPDLPFRKNATALSKAFPQFSDNIVAVIDGKNTDLVDQAADKFAKTLSQKPEIFGEVFDPEALPFFRENGLLYLSEDELEELSNRLIEAQPFLGSLWQNPTLPGLFDLITLLVKEGSDNVELLNAAHPILTNISRVIEAKSQGKFEHFSWQEIISGEKNSNAARIILIQPKADFSSLQPGENAITELRKIASQLNFAENYGARLRLTGSIPLAEEELKSVVDGLGLAGILSLTLVLFLLLWGLKSFRLVLATLVTLLCGLAWTAGFAIFAVGTLNLISIAFAVLFIGLSVDFGIHFALRYSEEKEDGSNRLESAAKKIGGALALSAIAAAIGFLSFLPTDYTGLAELGLIAGGGMFIALFANLTLLPALITLMPTKPKAVLTATQKPINLINYHKPILALSIILMIASLFAIPKVLFDFDPLNLKNTKTESVSTFFDLMATGKGNPYAITILAKNLAEADALAAKAKQLEVVDSAITLSSFVPMEQVEKLAMLDNLALILGPSLVGTPSSIESTPIQRLQATADLQKQIKSLTNSDTKFVKAIVKLNDNLSNLLTTQNPEKALKELEARLLASLPDQLNRLKRALNVGHISLKNIPPVLKSRQMTEDGRVKLEILPKGNMRDRSELTAFVNAVHQIAPDATGTPVIILEAGTTVVKAFVQAAATTIMLIIALVLLLTRSLREIVLIFTPLLLAAIFTLAASVIFQLPFNFANVIVLPLLFGLGIAGSIHLVFRDRVARENVMNTTTPRAISFSALTTIGSFGSIALSSHPGTASMGILLTISIILSLICTLIVLPALLKIWPKEQIK